MANGQMGRKDRKKVGGGGGLGMKPTHPQKTINNPGAPKVGVEAFRKNYNPAQQKQGGEGNKEGNAAANPGGTAYTSDEGAFIERGNQTFRIADPEGKSLLGGTGGGLSVVKPTDADRARIAQGAAAYDARMAKQAEAIKRGHAAASGRVSQYEQDIAARNRKMMYRQILGNAGAGPGKDINMKDALAAIARMEQDRTTKRGQDIQAETALAGQRSQERRTAMDVEQSALDREARKEREAAGLEIDRDKLGLLEDKFMEEARQAGVAEQAAAATAASKQKLDIDKAKREQLGLMLESLKLADPQKMGLEGDYEAILGGIMDALQEYQGK